MEKAQTALAFEKKPPSMAYRFERGSLVLVRDETHYAYVSADAGGLARVEDESRAVAAPYYIAERDDTMEVIVYDLPGFGYLILTQYPGFFSINGIIFAAPDGIIRPYMSDGTPVDVNTPIKSMGFTGREGWGSQRGYIWSRALPILLQHPFIGSGPDTFINVFPQDDVLGKAQYANAPYLVVDKAHNIFLQTGITTGGISMLAFMALLGLALFASFKTAVNGKKNSPAPVGLAFGLFASVVAFMVASLATDGTIPTTAVFFVLMGFAMAVVKPESVSIKGVHDGKKI
jgi:hypothetical protein